MNSEQAALLLRIQQVGLTMDDLREYLDTHPMDSGAIQRFNSSAAEYAAMKDEYSRRFTPLCSASQNNNEREWLWALSDFSWDH